MGSNMKSTMLHIPKRVKSETIHYKNDLRSFFSPTYALHFETFIMHCFNFMTRNSNVFHLLEFIL